MNHLNQYKPAQLQQVLGKFSKDLRLVVTDVEIREAFTTAGLAQPTDRGVKLFRTMLSAEREKTTEALLIQLGDRFDYEPKPGAIVVALEAAGYTFSRHYQIALIKRLKELNSERWATAAASETTTKLTMIEGEKAMWDALMKAYNMNSVALASMLLRVFAVVTSTGKINLLDVPYLASSLKDKELKRYAESLTFTVKRSRKSRA